ncbi:MAG: hypothetical protein WCK04_04700 [Actinomycetes bacterium]
MQAIVNFPAGISINSIPIELVTLRSLTPCANNGAQNNIAATMTKRDTHGIPIEGVVTEDELTREMWDAVATSSARRCY